MDLSSCVFSDRSEQNVNRCTWNQIPAGILWTAEATEPILETFQFKGGNVQFSRPIPKVITCCSLLMMMMMIIIIIVIIFITIIIIIISIIIIIIYFFYYVFIIVIIIIYIYIYIY